MSELLKKLIGCRDSADSAAKCFDAYAERIATNRVVAGFHFPVDSMAGCMLGTCLIDYVQRLATPDAVNFRRINSFTQGRIRNSILKFGAVRKTFRCRRSARRHRGQIDCRRRTRF